MSSPVATSPAISFLKRHDFLIRRLHSLSGLVPVGAYMCVHLLTNASLIGGASVFQNNVFTIHSLPLLPVIEWSFIFLPIIFHAVAGVWISRTGKSNLQNYSLAGNRRYSWQRITAYIAIVFIFTHVFHLHGWFQNEWWLKSVADPLGMANFRPYNAASSLANAMAGFIWPIFYVIGVLACTFHFANGIWTAGITWGVWLTPKSQARASIACALFGVFIGAAGLSSLVAVKATNAKDAEVIENEMYEARLKEHTITPDDHKRSGQHHAEEVKPVPLE
ncbi:MAG: succinate dehydrogenase cytochrome b558 subunit [Planctomycetota bacterium]|nr:succinate dehydrogenase cytochrome b558 subunit [Planctomycetota bacterium]